jgi:hypothetical protein
LQYLIPNKFGFQTNSAAARRETDAIAAKSMTAVSASTATV